MAPPPLWRRVLLLNDPPLPVMYRPAETELAIPYIHRFGCVKDMCLDVVQVAGAAILVAILVSIGIATAYAKDASVSLAIGLVVICAALSLVLSVAVAVRAVHYFRVAAPHAVVMARRDAADVRADALFRRENSRNRRGSNPLFPLSENEAPGATSSSTDTGVNRRNSTVKGVNPLRGVVVGEEEPQWFWLDEIVDASHASQRGPCALTSLAERCSRDELRGGGGTLVRLGTEGVFVALRDAIRSSSSRRDGGGRSATMPTRILSGGSAVTAAWAAAASRSGVSASRSTGKRAARGRSNTTLGGRSHGHDTIVNIPATSAGCRVGESGGWWQTFNIWVGMRIVHPTRGNGIVVAVDCVGDNRVHVRFTSTGDVHRYSAKSWEKFFSLHDLFTSALGVGIDEVDNDGARSDEGEGSNSSSPRAVRVPREYANV